MEPQTIEKVKVVIQEMLDKLGAQAKLSESLRSDGDQELLVINIVTDEPKLLIGQQGVNLQALQHVARLLVRKNLNQMLNFMLDINEYKTKRMEFIKNTAHEAIQRVMDSGKYEVLRPMSAYERRLVHTMVTNYGDIQAESIGREPNRRILIRKIADDKPLEEIIKEIENLRPAQNTDELEQIEQELQQQEESSN